jgi:hypothetical protein
MMAQTYVSDGKTGIFTQNFCEKKDSLIPCPWSAEKIEGDINICPVK